MVCPCLGPPGGCTGVECYPDDQEQLCRGRQELDYARN
eukprot:CAMPEP_0175892436 /NCGR_PEP_ID=MMETSP0107_2-20121207/48915_1 /TAXON_ID=195067 ORGANISM="Goniomonas pacifica, Strain CCMP1869" /NCGR_SAMPLE_ID=MMETSP0107_2 /ASSEMBLY_ACC=CAM_ASM_000203 /LENGTH=37 /DNA_ID= /DNA_START= /DNA_END= /DNA_ORIENTATION=